MRVFQFLTDYLQILNILITFISIIAAEVHVLSGGYSRTTLVWINVYIFVWLLYLVGLFLWKLDDGQGNYREDISFSFAMISICGIVARVFLFCFCDSSKLVQFFWFFTFNALSIHCYMPVQLSREYYTLPYAENAPMIIFITSILSVALLLSLFVAAGFPESFNEIMITQLYYSSFTASFIDYMINRTDGIEEFVDLVRAREEQRVFSIRQRPAPPHRASFPDVTDVIRVHRSHRQRSGQRPHRPKCEICLRPYSEHVIPRILITCWHSVCQYCIGRIMDEMERVRCPVCRKVTVVRGSIENLPTNYALLDYAGPQLSG